MKDSSLMKFCSMLPVLMLAGNRVKKYAGLSRLMVRNLPAVGGSQNTFDTDIRWISKEDIPLLKKFEPIGPPPILLANAGK